MPRIRPSDFRRACAIDKALPALLPVCRDIGTARNELRWLHEHATFVSQRVGTVNQQGLLQSFIARRSRGEPLQYILGSEFFGDLEIKCRPGVLIPRQETAASVSYLVSLLQARKFQCTRLRVLDLCSGSGCIPLLFHDEFYKNADRQKVNLELLGVDISSDPLSLARENLLHQIANNNKNRLENSTRISSLNHIGFVQADILRNNEHDDSENAPSLWEALQRLNSDTDNPTFDILISNPPYISPAHFRRTTARSVRDFEPRLALVPPQKAGILDSAIGDTFYPKLLQIAEQVDAKVVLFEVADMDQAKRVAALTVEQGVFENIEIWRDEPAHTTSHVEQTTIGDQEVRVRGRGNGRSVFAWRKQASSCLIMERGGNDGPNE